MTTSYTFHAQVTKTEDVKNRRRVTQQKSSVRVLADKSYLEGTGILNPGQFANMFRSAEFLYLTSDQPLTISLLNPETDVIVAEIKNTRSFSFDLVDTGESYKVVAEVSGQETPANIDWFAFDNLTTGSITGISFMIQEQVNQLLTEITEVQSDLITLQISDETTTTTIAALQTQLTALQSQVLLLDVTNSDSGDMIAEVELTLAQLIIDITALEDAIDELRAAQILLQEEQALLRLQTDSQQDQIDLSVLPQLGDQAALIDTNATSIEMLDAAVMNAQVDLNAAELQIVTNTNTIANQSNQFQALFSGLSDTSNEVLSLQQLMATTNQNVANNATAISDNMTALLEVQSNITQMAVREKAFSFSGSLPDDTQVASYDFTKDHILRATSSNRGSATIPATSEDAVFEITRNGTAIGAVIFPANATTPIFNIPSDVLFGIESKLTIRTSSQFELEDASFTLQLEEVL